MNLAEAEANLFFIFYNKRIECYSNYCTCLIQLDANLNIGIHLYFLKNNDYVPICLVIIVLIQFTHIKYTHISPVEIL